MQEKALRGVPWTLMSYASSKLVAIPTTLVLAHLIVPADFGLLALATIATNFLSWIADMGFSGAVVLRQDFDRRALGTLLTLMAVTGLGAAVIAVAFAPAVAAIFDNGRITGVLIAIATLLPLGSIAGFWDALLQRELMFRRRFYAMVGQALVTAAVSIPLAALGEGVWSLVIGQIAGYVTLGLMLVALAPYQVRPRFDRRVARSAFGTGRGFVGQGMAMYVRQNVDTVAVGLAFGERGLGYYSMANRFGDLVYWTVAHPVANVTFPSFARDTYAGRDVGGQFLRVLRMVALVSCPIGIVMSASADPFTRAIFGDRWLPMIGPLTIMGLWAGVRQIDQTLGWLLNSVNRAGLVGWLSLIILLPLIAGCVLAVNVGGLTAVALVPLGDTLLSAMLSSIFVRRHVSLSFAAQWRAISPAVLASAPTWLVTWGVGRILHPAERPIVALVLSVLAGSLTYAAAVKILAPDLLAQSLGTVRKMFSRAPVATSA
jgi:O-antigen/teichoic acid export membrane protein